MSAVGVLAYGSLIADPGDELEPLVVDRVRPVLTPFQVEFARSSRTRGGAPTLVPVDQGGSSVQATILVLSPGVSEEDAIDCLWRRETRRIGSNEKYAMPERITESTVLIDRLGEMAGIPSVLTTRIGANIAPLTATS